MKKILLIWICMFVCFSQLTAQTVVRKNTFKVNVKITADSPEKEKLQSFVNRELRLLDDVTLDNKNRFQLDFKVAEIVSAEDRKTKGYAISMIILEQEKCVFKQNAYSNIFTEGSYPCWAIRFSNLTLVNNDFRTYAENTVALFDTNFLEVERARIKKSNKIQ